jgi:hypothetical protein
MADEDGAAAGDAAAALLRRCVALLAPDTGA